MSRRPSRPPASGSMFSLRHAGAQVAACKLQQRRRPPPARPGTTAARGHTRACRFEQQTARARGTTTGTRIGADARDHEQDERQPGADRSEQVDGRAVGRRVQQADVAPVVREQAQRQEQAAAPAAECPRQHAAGADVRLLAIACCHGACPTVALSRPERTRFTVFGIDRGASTSSRTPADAPAPAARRMRPGPDPRSPRTPG